VATISFGTISAQFCEVICGDGYRNVGEDCDDGNTDDGDGCSALCREEEGWTCSGGTSIQKSTCVEGEPQKAELEDKGAVFLPGKVIQSVRMSYIPECFTETDCSECFKILKAWVSSSTLPAIVKVNFIPGSKYQFTI
jgi:cysteine-rich repeat protein